MSTHPTVAILGASDNRLKFGNKSVRAHLRAGYTVYPVNPKGGEIEGLEVFPTLSDVPVEWLDRISVYLPPEIGLAMLDEIATMGCEEVWFNPGSESPEIFAKARDLGIRAIGGCSIVALGMSPAQFQ